MKNFSKALVLIIVSLCFTACFDTKEDEQVSGDPGKEQAQNEVLKDTIEVITGEQESVKDTISN